MDKGRYSNFKANKCTVELQISERFWLGMIIGDTEFIFVDLSHLSEIPNPWVFSYHKTLVNYNSCYPA